LLTAVFVLFLPTLLVLYRQRWGALGYTHAFFILPVSLWLVWREREALRATFKATKKKFERLYLGIFVFGSLMYLFGWRQDYMVISTFAMIPFLYGFTGFVYGRKVLRLVLFPILYLLLLVPPPFALLDRLTLPLRYISAFGVEGIFKVFMFPIQREGLMYVIGGHQMMIDEACSGFHSLITMFSLGLVYVYVTEGAPAKKVTLVSSIIPLAIIGNIVRIITISLIALTLGQGVAMGFMHYFSGVVIFLFIVLGFIGVEKAWWRITGTEKVVKPKEKDFEWFE